MEMTRQEKLIWGLMAGILIILFLLSSTDLIIKEKETTIYSGSVTIKDTNDDYYKNFRKGLIKPLMNTMWMSISSHYMKRDVEEQMELLKSWRSVMARRQWYLCR